MKKFKATFKLHGTTAIDVTCCKLPTVFTLQDFFNDHRLLDSHKSELQHDFEHLILDELNIHPTDLDFKYIPNSNHDWIYRITFRNTQNNLNILSHYNGDDIRNLKRTMQLANIINKLI